MKVTFLGHQGWLIQVAGFQLLVDPILAPYFRNSRHTKVWINPPRRIAVERLGQIDAVCLSHEHEDHFHIESLHLLDRSTAILISPNFSSAGEAILAEMGFRRLHRFQALSEMRIGQQAALTLFPPPASPAERWTMQMFVQEAGFENSFFNPVDCAVSPEFLEYLRARRAPTIGMFCLANNSQTPYPLEATIELRPPPASAAANFEPARVLNAHLGPGLNALPALRSIAVVGGGFVDGAAPFGTYRCSSQATLARVLAEYSYGQTLVVGPEPGDRFDLGAGAPPVLQRSEIAVDSPEALAALQRAEQMASAFSASRHPDPVTTAGPLSPAEIERLDRALAKLASGLVMAPIHVELVQQTWGRDRDGRRHVYGSGKLLLVLRNGEGNDPGLWLGYEYWPTHREFRRRAVPAEADWLTHFPFGFECWARDLLGLLEGDVYIYELIKYRCRQWGPEVPVVATFRITETLEYLFSPEVSVEAAHALYRSAYQRALAASGPRDQEAGAH